MTEHTKGRLSKITDPNKGGYVSLVVDDVYYGAEAKGTPPFKAGDVIEFDWYLKQDKYRTIKGQVKKCEDVATPSASNGPSTGKSGGYVSPKDKYWEDKDIYDKTVVQPRITYLAAYERALGFTDIVLREKAIPGLEKAKPEARLEIIQNFVSEITDAIIERSNTHKVADAVDAKVPAEEPAEEGWS